MRSEQREAVEQGYQEAARVVRRRARNFAFAFVGQPPSARRALHAVYAFCREADDAADDGRPPDAARRALAAQRQRLQEIFLGKPSLPRDLALQDAVRAYGIRQEDFLEVLTGVERDLTPRRYETFDDLCGYCYQVGSAVGLLCLPIFGRSDDTARRRAMDLGIGMQLTNILRDVGEDAGRDRLYLPLEDLRRFGVEETELLQAARQDGRGSAGERRLEDLEALLAFQVGRARGFLASGRGLLPLLEPRQRYCPRVLAALYGELLVRMERMGRRVLVERASLPRARKAWIAMSAFVQRGASEGGAP
ncbi:MAG: phytoene/squalene synthase family protein [Gemmatimonadota bacterium]